MRILAIGLGGAGCRIVNSLYATDRRSSKVICVQALAIDVNSDTLDQLGSLPEDAKLFFPPLDPDLHKEEEREIQTATIDIGEIVSRIHNFEIGETDAIFMCCGLGGSMVDVAPHVIASLRSSIAEPIFGLVTLPCLAEGERRSAKAADDIEMLSPLLDGLILSDNETWYKKIKAQRSTLVKKEKGLAEKLGFRKSEPEVSPRLATYLLLNEAIVRRIGLILRAGEFKADGGLDLAEVVLDSGEVLNTMKGMGFIAIGYAVERLPQHPLSFLTSWHPTGLFPDAHKLKASRIVDLAKQAIYHEISIPCDMTSAHKALILVAGPSHELSMKGYMTVRKWIDRSIAGLETRSGDYPVMNTKNVAIIIMLSGLENIPRLTELREIRSQYKSLRQESLPAFIQTVSDMLPEFSSEKYGIFSGEREETPMQRGQLSKDEMLVLPDTLRKSKITHKQDSGSFGQFGGRSQTIDQDIKNMTATEDVQSRTILQDAPDIEENVSDRFAAGSNISRVTDQRESAGGVDGFDTERHPVSHHHVIARDKDNQSKQSESHRPVHVSSVHGTPYKRKSSDTTDTRTLSEKPHINEDRLRTKEMERKIIERELQRQRTMAISGHKKSVLPGLQPHTVHTSETVRLKRSSSKKKSPEVVPEQSDSVEVSPILPEKRRIVIQKKKVHSEIQETPVSDNESRYVSGKDDDKSIIMRSEKYSRQTDSRGLKVDIKDSAYTSKDHILEGRVIDKSVHAPVKDSALTHTHLRSKKKSLEPERTDEQEGIDNPSPGNRAKNTSKKDEISWI